MHNNFRGEAPLEEGTPEQLKESLLQSVAPYLKDFSGPLCEDPKCFRSRPHFPREYGCRWSDIAIAQSNGTTIVYKDDWKRDIIPPRVEPSRA